MDTNVPIYYQQLSSPLGSLLIFESDKRLLQVSFDSMEQKVSELEGKEGYTKKWTPFLKKVATQLKEYFNQERRTFDLELAPQGTAFQQKA